MTNIHNAAREALEALEELLRQFTRANTIADLAARGNARLAIATLRAALDEAPGEEREAFEAWALSEGLAVDRFHADSDYIYQPTSDGWAAWQARAMLAARPSAPTVALTEEQRAVLLFLDGWESLDGVWFGDPHPTQTGAFWWRRHLVRAFPWLTKGKEGGA